MEILNLINFGSKYLKAKNITSHRLDSEILLSNIFSSVKLTLLLKFKSDGLAIFESIIENSLCR